MPHRCLIFLATICLFSLNACSSIPQGSRAPSTANHPTKLSGALAAARTTTAGGLRSAEDRRAYADAVEQVVISWQAQKGQVSRGRPLVVRNGDRPWTVSASWPASVRFDELVPAAAPGKRKLSRSVLREGVGSPFVAWWHPTDERKKKEPFMAEAGYMVPVTVTLDFRDSGKGGREVALRVHDPRVEETAMISGRRQPLAADFSAIHEFILVKSKEKGVGMSGLRALRHSEKYLDKLGLIALEPPSRDRIPVIFVHGLMSRPLTWINAFNELGDDPVIRKNYQVYFFRYPTGVPVVYSSAKFRAQLASLHQELTRIGDHDAAHHVVLIGHSMGGLVSKMQVLSSGDRLWMNVFGAKPTELGLSKEELTDFRQYLEFQPNADVDRIIFVCTPHRGSKMAAGFIGSVGRRLVSLPGRVLGTTFDLLQGEAPRNSVVQQLVKRGIPTSIENFAPESRFVIESMQMPIKPGVHVHSIIGNKHGRPLTDPKCSDGVVPYTSAHLDGVESEFIVHSNHGAHERPEAIAEMGRILRLHLRSLPGASR